MNGVEYACKEGIGRITFNRPKANAYDLPFHEAFSDAIKTADTDAGARVIVIQSALDKFFCAGADIKVFADSDTETNKKMVEQARANLAAIEASGKIFIAAISGHCLGGGLEIALACDIRLAAKGNYTLGLPEVKLGLTPGNGGSQRLARLIGPARALELCVSGRSIDPDEANELGLFSRLFKAGSFETAVETYAGGLVPGAPLAMAALKRGIQKGAELPLAEGLALETQLVDDLYDTEDAAEGFRAFVEKRAPVYRGC
ncbi:enoyl-CoA hydratase/isomerase family protein [Pontiella agarivorans]|uniref:Enoyl-CoA hydratase/isomerase family protein n=1 Tax=Pontiella agarivorans TaxID=3038953 RepID=A0ABU5MUJ7_9BACT|nr:enoyl-CoA hydratase/isomerase family protein [Pontiella agarivorans]MDZ8117808.1 enoyl-CoA hydratase/isomerase family protein [Pontiella agarivorans]